MEAESSKLAPVVPPRGTFQTRVDDKGRLKLPAVFLQYLKDLGEEKVFITSLDQKTARIYPISVWVDNEKLFESETEDSSLSESIAWMANHFGADSDIDAQGRVLVPTDLRRFLKIENEQVRLNCYKGRINVIGEAEYEAQRVQHMANLADAMKVMEKKGLK